MVHIGGEKRKKSKEWEHGEGDFFPPTKKTKHDGEPIKRKRHDEKSRSKIDGKSSASASVAGKYLFPIYSIQEFFFFFPPTAYINMQKILMWPYFEMEFVQYF